ncbi:MAG: ABC transporter permease [Xanthomonadales bacterium]|nr:ABC transporter permease [Xanthomonadales bacterium]
MNARQSLRQAPRHLARAPGFTIAAVGMLTLGIGLSVAMFSALGGVVLRGLPFPQGDRLVVIESSNPGRGIGSSALSTAEAQRLAGGVDGLVASAYFQWSGVTVIDGGHPREIQTQQVSAGFFETLAQAPLLGRTLDREDAREGRAVAVLSHAEWISHFGADPDVVGRRLDLVGDAPVEIVGVMPPGMRSLFGSAALWTPLQQRALPDNPARRLDLRMLTMIARRDAATTPAQLDAALAQRLDALHREHGLADEGWRLSARPALDALVGDARGTLWGAFALALMVLLIATVNVAILIDARLAARERELAVKQALGATAARLASGLLAEVALLAGAAVAGGSLLAWIGIDALRGLAAGSIPRTEAIALDGRVLAVAILLGLLVPLATLAIGGSRVRATPMAAIRGGGRSLVGHPPRRWLPAMAMGLSTVCLAVALALGFGLWRLQRVDPGFHSDGVHALQLFRESMQGDAPSPGPDGWRQFAGEVQERIAAIPGVQAVAMTTAAPLSRIGGAAGEARRGDAPATPGVQALLRRVSPGYAALLDMPLLEGRDIDAADRAGGEAVAVLNRSLARQLFGDASPLGRTVSLPLGSGGRSDFRVVGVVADTSNVGLRARAEPEALVAWAQQPRVAMTFLARTRPSLRGIDAAMREALWAVDPRQAITREYALADDIADELRPARFFAAIVGAFAAAALLLAVLGAYAVAALQQRRRIAEFGLRLALGARARDLALTVVRGSVLSSALGIGAGLAAVALALRRIDLDPVGIRGIPAEALAAAIALMALAALLASLLPALRAARVAPMEALRDE